MKRSFNGRIDKQKTKIMVCVRNKADRIRIKLENMIVGEVEELSLLSIITSNIKSFSKFVRRINKAKNAFSKIQNQLVKKKSVKYEKESLATHVLGDMGKYGRE